MPGMPAIPPLPDGWHRAPASSEWKARSLWALFLDGAPVALVERKRAKWEITTATAILDGHATTDGFEAARGHAEKVIREKPRSEIWAGHIARCWFEVIW